MKNTVIGFLLAVVLALGVWTASVARTNHQLTKAMAIYLFSDTEVKDPKGKPLTRADLIDLILRDVIERSK